MKTKKRFRFIPTYLWFVLIWMMVAFPAVSLAFFNINDTDREKPKPEFTREAEQIVAKLIPRAKSNSITILFKSEGGNIAKVAGFDINSALDPQINPKDFRSELFSVEIEGLAPGGEATLSIASSFFSSSTYFWVFNQGKTPAWRDAKADHIRLADKVQELKIRIKDGGELDADGAANGRVTLVGGPQDSFWGYVLGTLFIRFFGVFIVLAVLMVGMLLSGLIFQKIGRKRLIQEAALPSQPDKIPMESEIATPLIRANAEMITPEMAGAIGVALALELSSKMVRPSSSDGSSDASSWVMDGRQRMMADRINAFYKNKH